MSYGRVYFARNKTGVKIGFTKISFKKKLVHLNISQLSGDFTIINSIYVHKPKLIKEKIIEKILKKKINREIFDLSNDEINKLCQEFNVKIEDSDFESEEESDYDYESELESDYESDYECKTTSENDSNTSKNKKNIFIEFNKLNISEEKT